MSASVEHLKRVGFIGAGRMATALSQGLVTAEFTSADCIVACDVLSAARERFADATGALVVKLSTDVLANAEIVFLAVKPQQMANILTEIKSHVTTDHLIVSIAAGIPLRMMVEVLGDDRRLVRVMPNTPCLVGESASGFALGGAASDDDGILVQKMLSTVGIAVAVDESLLDAVTGLSGSGPAYVYEFIEALSEAGVCMGLPHEMATKLAVQTVFGAAQMVLQTGEHPVVLKNAVTSPGGTTIAGLRTLEQGGLRNCVIDAVRAATLRSKELGQPS